MLIYARAAERSVNNTTIGLKNFGRCPKRRINSEGGQMKSTHIKLAILFGIYILCGIVIDATGGKHGLGWAMFGTWLVLYGGDE